MDIDRRKGRDREDGRNAEVAMSVRSFTRYQYGAVACLTLLGTVHYLVEAGGGGGALPEILELFDPGKESSVTTYFSVINLLVAAALLFVIHRDARARAKPMPWHWLALSLVFVYLSLDEGAAIHERAGGRFYEAVGLALPLIQTHRWLIAGVLFTVVIGAFFTPFLLRLDAPTRLRFVLAGGIFVAGALGIEFIGAIMINQGGFEKVDLAYKLRRIGEEGCELLGIALFNCALFARFHREGIVFELSSKR